MKEITIVTAFFDIGRKNFKAIPRSNNTYMNNFRFWARIKNDLIVYTDKESANEILRIRTDFNLQDKTQIIIIDNVFDIESDIYNNMKKISQSQWFKDYRILPNATSNIAEYSYLMLLKSFFLSDSVNRGLTKEQVAWIDFGYNHGGTLFTNEEEFDFLWQYDFTEKIQLFYYKNYDEKPIFEIVRRLCDSIMGSPIITPAKLANELWSLNKNSMINLNKIGLMDDDQLIQIMSYREKPELFELHESEWFLPIKDFGGGHLSIRDLNNVKMYKLYARKIKLQYLKRKYALMNAIKTYRNLVNKE